MRLFLHKSKPKRTKSVRVKPSPKESGTNIKKLVNKVQLRTLRQQATLPTFCHLISSALWYALLCSTSNTIQESKEGTVYGITPYLVVCDLHKIENQYPLYAKRIMPSVAPFTSQVWCKTGLAKRSARSCRIVKCVRSQM